MSDMILIIDARIDTLKSVYRTVSGLYCSTYNDDKKAALEEVLYLIEDRIEDLSRGV